jgi:hypothetical protein
MRLNVDFFTEMRGKCTGWCDATGVAAHQTSNVDDVKGSWVAGWRLPNVAQPFVSAGVAASFSRGKLWRGVREFQSWGEERDAPVVRHRNLRVVGFDGAKGEVLGGCLRRGE